MEFEMTLKPYQRRRLVSALRRIPEDLKTEFVTSVDRWIQCNGPEWTIARVKSLKLDLLRFVADGSKPLTPWVAKNRRGYLCHCLGRLFCLAKRSTPCFREVVALFQIHTMYVSKELTPAQERKFREGLFSRGDDLYGSRRPYIVGCRQAADAVIGSLRLRSTQPLMDAGPEYGADLITNFCSWLTSCRGREFYRRFPHVVHELVPSSLVDKCIPMVGTNSIGDVWVHQQGGFKARFYASPELWVQWVLKPLGDAVFDAIKALPWDCTHDQGRAISPIQERMRTGQKIYSFDLSSATDRFPFDLQLATILSLLDGGDLTPALVYEHLVQSPFRFLGSINDEVIWAKGQPLGTYPSFAVFALTHGLLLYSLNGMKWDGNFFVLGDDVVILDDSLASAYERALRDLEVSWSPGKTIASRNIAEFAGKIITPYKVFQAPKWKPWYHRIIPELGRLWEDTLFQVNWGKDSAFFRWWVSLPPPYGAGLNPDGISLQDRLEGMELYFGRETYERLAYHIDRLPTAYSRIQSLSSAMEGRLFDYLLPFIEDVRRSDQERVTQLLSQFGYANFLNGMDLWALTTELDFDLIGLKPKKWGTDIVSRRYLQLMRECFLTHSATLAQRRVSESLS